MQNIPATGILRSRRSKAIPAYGNISDGKDIDKHRLHISMNIS